MLTQSTVTLSNLLPGEQGMESPCRGRRPVVQDVHEGGLSPGRQRVRLPLLEEHAARLQELGQNGVLQLEGGLELFPCGEAEYLFFTQFQHRRLSLSGEIVRRFTLHHQSV